MAGPRGGGWGAGGPGPWPLGCGFSLFSTENGFRGHGCRWKDPSDLSSTRPKIRHEDVFPRPNDHFKARGGHAGPPTTRPSRLSVHQARGWGRGGGPGPRPLACHFPIFLLGNHFRGHGCRWKEQSDLSPTRTKTLNEDVFLRPNGHFEDSDGQHAAGLPPGQQGEEAGETGETPPLLSPAGG